MAFRAEDRAGAKPAALRGEVSADAELEGVLRVRSQGSPLEDHTPVTTWLA